MALVRPLEVNCRYDYIYFNPYNQIEVVGLGSFSLTQFLSLVEAYPQDFPADIKDRLIHEMGKLLKLEA